MYVLSLWHTVPDYPEWKKVFDSDPLGARGPACVATPSHGPSTTSTR